MNFTIIRKFWDLLTYLPSKHRNEDSNQTLVNWRTTEVRSFYWKRDHCELSDAARDSTRIDREFQAAEAQTPIKPTDRNIRTSKLRGTEPDHGHIQLGLNLWWLNINWLWNSLDNTTCDSFDRLRMHYTQMKVKLTLQENLPHRWFRFI